MMKMNQPYFILTLSPWPIIAAINIFNLMISNLMMINYKFNFMLIMNVMLMMIISMMWWRDIIRESTFQGNHNFYIMNLLKFGMILFIISELFLFISFFWNFLHNSLSPSIELGLNWPPKNINFFNPMMIPLLNTIVLLTSSFTITLSHFYLLKNSMKMSKIMLLLTIMLSTYFLMLQALEYNEATFTFSDSIFGSSFYIATGFHGMHVMIGTIFLLVNLVRMMKMHLSFMHHISFELAAWYWHFVDVIWLFLYVMIYWWNN